MSDKSTIANKVSYIGAPAIFELKLACQQLDEAFDSFGIYHVGSSLDRPDWRDVDVRMIMNDADFEVMFPGVLEHVYWEFNPRWLIMTGSISAWLSERTGLPIDFQFQPQSYANKKFNGRRDCLNLKIK